MENMTQPFRLLLFQDTMLFYCFELLCNVGTSVILDFLDDIPPYSFSYPQVLFCHSICHWFLLKPFQPRKVHCFIYETGLIYSRKMSLASNLCSTELLRYRTSELFFPLDNTVAVTVSPNFARWSEDIIHPSCP